MLIIAGYLLTEPELRDQIIDDHRDLVERARATPGCLDLAISPDPLDPARINNFELWESEAALHQWRPSANAPDIARHIRGGQMQQYAVESAKDPFGA